MGCLRTAVIDGIATVNIKVSDICFVPPQATEGQMTFKNIGTTTIYLRVGQGAGSKDVSAARASMTLAAGEAVSDDGLVAGFVIASSSADGGTLQFYIPWRS